MSTILDAFFIGGEKLLQLLYERRSEGSIPFGHAEQAVPPQGLSGDECHELAEKYFETHKQMTLPGQVLVVDLRPAYRKPLANVTPQFRAVSKGHTFTPQR